MPGKEQEEKENGEIGRKGPAPEVNRAKRERRGPWLVEVRASVDKALQRESRVRSRKGGAPSRELRGSQSRGGRSTESSASWGVPESPTGV